MWTNITSIKDLFVRKKYKDQSKKIHKHYRLKCTLMKFFILSYYLTILVTSTVSKT